MSIDWHCAENALRELKLATTIKICQIADASTNFDTFRKQHGGKKIDWHLQTLIKPLDNNFSVGGVFIKMLGCVGKYWS